MIETRTTQPRRRRLVRIFETLPEVEVSGDQHLAFAIRKKKFAYYLNDHHGDGVVALACKAAPGELEYYLEWDAERFFAPAYLGSRGWVGFRLDLPRVDWKQAEALAREAYRLQAPKRLVAELEGPKREDDTRGKRPRHVMPADVERALVKTRLLAAYRERPPYQRNDYLGWIGRAKRPDTRQRRLAQMLEELERGDVYMKMPHGGNR